MKENSAVLAIQILKEIIAKETLIPNGKCVGGLQINNYVNPFKFNVLEHEVTELMNVFQDRGFIEIVPDISMPNPVISSEDNKLIYFYVDTKDKKEKRISFLLKDIKGIRSFVSKLEAEFGQQVKSNTDNVIIKNKKRITLPRFSRTEWSKVSIRFVDERNVIISNGVESKASDFVGLGFEDERTGRPDSSWKFLLDIAKNNGESELLPKGDRSTRKKKKQRIVDVLRNLFQNQTDPFEDFYSTKTYKARFKLIPPTEDKEIDPLYRD